MNPHKNNKRKEKKKQRNKTHQLVFFFSVSLERSSQQTGL
jgi:hypothetical protein